MPRKAVSNPSNGDLRDMRYFEKAKQLQWDHLPIVYTQTPRCKEELRHAQFESRPKYLWVHYRGVKSENM